jgi:hypothetical protein
MLAQSDSFRAGHRQPWPHDGCRPPTYPRLLDPQDVDGVAKACNVAEATVTVVDRASLTSMKIRVVAWRAPVLILLRLGLVPIPVLRADLGCIVDAGGPRAEHARRARGPNNGPAPALRGPRGGPLARSSRSPLPVTNPPLRCCSEWTTAPTARRADLPPRRPAVVLERPMPRHGTDPERTGQK